jgi:hypothetical protein
MTILEIALSFVLFHHFLFRETTRTQRGPVLIRARSRWSSR